MFIKPTLLDFNKLEQRVIDGFYQGRNSKSTKAFHNGQYNRKALFQDLPKVFARELGIWSVSDLSPRQKEYINCILNMKLNETNKLKLESSQTRQLAFVRAVRNYVAQGEYFYFIFEKELKDIYFKEVEQ